MNTEKTFRSFLNEAQAINTLEGAIQAILKNTHYNKNAVARDGKLFFEFKSGKGAMNLTNRLTKYYVEGLNGTEAGVIDFYKVYEQAVLGIDAKGYLILNIQNLTPDIISLAKAKELSDAEYNKNYKIAVSSEPKN